MSTIKGLFIFAVGALTGTFVGAQIAKKKYEAIANEEIEEIRAYYKDKQQEVKEVEEPEEKDEEVKKERNQYDNIINKGNYMTVDEEERANQYDEPYPIDPSEFGKDGEYATETCTYFADGVLVNEADEVIDDAYLAVGRHHIDIFNEFPDATCVYIRNDLEGTDYEILKDDWCWADFDDKGYAPPLQGESDKKPHQL